MKNRRDRRRQEQEYRSSVAKLGGCKAEVLSPIEVANSNREDRQLVPIQKANIPSDRVVVTKRNLSLVFLAYSLGIVGLGINAWYAWNRGTDLPDKVLMSCLGFFLEATFFYLPAQTSNLWKGRRYGAFLLSCVVCGLLFVFALTNSLGFASENLKEVSTAKAERITPAVSDAQRRLDTLSASRANECLKRGDRCRQLEKDEQQALESLREAREKVSATSDPQIASAAKLIAWVSLGRFHPSADDFAMLRLLLLTLLPQLGGMILMVSSTFRT